MKFSYALIRKLLPSAPPIQTLTAGLNAHSFEVEGVSGDLFEVKLPANIYSYAASHIGIARETAAIFNLKLKRSVVRTVNVPEGKGLIAVKVADVRLCPRYAARYFEIKKPKPSLRETQKILATCGINPVNNIVDLMNYVMLETGQPLHAFDADKVADKRGQYADRRGKDRHAPALTVRRAKKNEKIETLDGQKFVLDADALVIADARQPLAIAGVKGGLRSGITEETRRIVVEAANFDQISIYRTSRKLKLTTDASARFAHDPSPTLVGWGMDRVTELLRGEGAELLDSVDRYPQPVGDEVIDFDPKKYETLIGSPISIAEAEKYFCALGLEPKAVQTKSGNFLRVRVPSWRNDLENAEDLYEEIARLVGYTKLRKTVPTVTLQSVAEEDAVVMKDRIRMGLVQFQLDETCNHSFVGEKDVRAWRKEYAIIGRSAKPLEIANPIAEDKKYLRPSLVPLLLKNVRDNSRFYDEVRLFEVGRVFGKVGGAAREKLVAGIVLAAKKAPKAILELKGIADGFLKSLGLTDFSFVPRGGYLLVESDGHVVAELQSLGLEKGWTAAVAEIDAEKLLQIIREEREFRPFPKYPSVIRDISVLVSKDARIGDMVQLIQEVNVRLIDDVDLIDEYVDEKLGGRQSLTFRIVFRAEDRTLTDAEVNMEMKKTFAALKRKFRAEIR